MRKAIAGAVLIGVVANAVFADADVHEEYGAKPTYIVKKGDTLWRIAKAHGLNYEQLRKSNGKQQDWSSIHPGEKIVVAQLLDESGDVALFAGKTESDIAFNKSNAESPRNSLFMRRRSKVGTNEWMIVMTAEGDWQLAEGMSRWCEDRASDASRDFDVMKARLSKDGRFIWMVCNPHIGTYDIVCSFELATKKFRVLIDGDSVEEQADGTLFVRGKKTYLSDEKGEPLGAAWYDLWITPDGKVVRKTKPISKTELEEEWAASQQKKKGL